MSDNGEPSRPKRQPKITPRNKPPWLVSYAEAKKAEHYMATRFTPAARRMHEKLALDDLMLSKKGAWRIALMGHYRRQKFVQCFVETMEEGGGKILFEHKCHSIGISPMLIALVLGIIWDVLFYWWTHRKDAR